MVQIKSFFYIRNKTMVSSIFCTYIALKLYFRSALKKKISQKILFKQNMAITQSSDIGRVPMWHVTYVYAYMFGREL